MSSGKQNPKEPVKKEPVIHAGGRELRFLFDVRAWCEIEEIFGSLQIMNQRMGSKEKPMEASLALIAVTMNAWNRHTGAQADITTDWLKENLTPGQVTEAALFSKAAVVEGMKREDAQEEEDTDVGAEELQKKTGA